MSEAILRWFGVIKKRNGKIVFTSTLVRDCPEQKDFLKSVLKFEKGDTVLELLQSKVWQPKDFVHYCNDAYLKTKPQRDTTVRVPVSQYTRG
jgi:hypothetical protein